MLKKIRVWDISILFLGIGIGIILSVAIFYYNPVVKYREYSDDQIVEKYTEIKLKEQRENEKNNNKNNKKKDEKKNMEDSITKLEFNIEKGQSLDAIINNLYNKEVIDNKESFLDRLKVREVTGKIQYGTYNIELPIDYDDLIDKIIIK